MKHQLHWFKNRIGKRIYRDKCGCTCKICTQAWHKGVIVRDEQYAEYLHMVQYDLDINYRDEK